MELINSFADSFASLTNSVKWSATDNDDDDDDDENKGGDASLTLVPDTLPHYSSLPPLFDDDVVAPVKTPSHDNKLFLQRVR